MPAVIAPGNHDGVHLGHRALLARANTLAAQRGLSTVALTFDPHPAALLAPDHAPPLLTTMTRRRQLLLGLGADQVHVQPFDRAFANISPEAFVRGLLVEQLHAASLVIGPDFRFGAARAGDVELLRTMGRELGFDVHVVPPVELDGERVSSSRVRAAVTAGDVELAARLLNRVHEVTGEVQRGDGRGKSIGFATANLTCEPTLLPRDGVYAVVVGVVGQPDRGKAQPGQPALGQLLGVCNLGVRPTFGAGRSVEVHLFDFDADLYGVQLRVGFVAHIRGERRFAGVDALRAQIAQDVTESRTRLAHAPKEYLSWI